jgi:UDP-glucose 4-epimerase
MNILVTGAGGFIGKNLANFLILRKTDDHLLFHMGRAKGSTHPLIEGWPTRGKEPGVERFRMDLTKEGDVRWMMGWAEPDVIYHLAGNAMTRPDAVNPCQISKDNVLATHHLLEYCKERTRFVLASSATVYGDFDGDAVEHSPLRPTSVYGATKLAQEALVSAYSRQGKVRGCILRLVANVGKYATHGLLKDLITKVKSDSPTLELLGDAPGSNKHYCYVDDTVNALVHFAESGVDQPVNISSYTTLTVEQVAELVMQVLNRTKPIKWLGAGANWKGDNRFVSVSTRLAALFSWHPVYSDSADAVVEAVKEIEGIK